MSARSIHPITPVGISADGRLKLVPHVGMHLLRHSIIMGCDSSLSQQGHSEGGSLPTLIVAGAPRFSIALTSCLDYKHKD